jgi:hypothetical protein
MANPYGSMYQPEPTNVVIIDHDEIRKVPIYSFLGFGGLMNTMICTPSIGDLMHPSDDEPANERNLEAGDLLYQNIDKGVIPSNPRVRQAFGFHLCHTDAQAASLLEAYTRVKSKGVHYGLLDLWRTTATMETHIGDIIRDTAGGGRNAVDKATELHVLVILFALDKDMKGKV